MAPVSQVCFIATLPVATRGIAEVKNAPKKYSKGSQAMRVIFVQVNRRHLWVWYPVLIIHPWASWRMNGGWTLYVTFFLCLRSHSHPRHIWPMRRILTWLLVMRFGSIVVKRHRTKKIQKVYYLIHLVLLEILVLWKSVYVCQCFDWEVFHEGVSEKQGLSWKVRLFWRRRIEDDSVS